MKDQNFTTGTQQVRCSPADCTDYCSLAKSPRMQEASQNERKTCFILGSAGAEECLTALFPDGVRLLYHSKMHNLRGLKSFLHTSRPEIVPLTRKANISSSSTRSQGQIPVHALTI